jgi:hypothetical protein
MNNGMRMRRVSATESLGILTAPAYSAHHTHLQGMDAWCFPLRSPNGGVGIEIILVVSSVVNVDVVFVFLVPEVRWIGFGPCRRGRSSDSITSRTRQRAFLLSLFPPHPIARQGDIVQIFPSDHEWLRGTADDSALQDDVRHTCVPCRTPGWRLLVTTIDTFDTPIRLSFLAVKKPNTRPLICLAHLSCDQQRWSISMSRGDH